MRNWAVISILIIIFFAGCAAQEAEQSAPAAEITESAQTQVTTNTITIDTQRRHLGDNRMPESRSPEWAPVRDPEGPSFEATFSAPRDIAKATLRVNVFGTESEANRVYLNGNDIGGLCVAFDKDGWKVCDLPIQPDMLKENNTIKIETGGSDRDDIMIESVYFVYE